MKKGTIRMSPEFLLQGIEFPHYWTLLSIHMNEGDRLVTAIIEGPDFPEVPDGEEPKECKVLVTKHEGYTFEVKEL